MDRLREGLPRNAGAALPSGAIHVVWTTGGSQLPDDQFEALLGGT
jgi:D-serine dehydratase